MEGNVSGLRDARGRFGDGFVVLIWLSFDEAPLPDGRPAGGRSGIGTVLLYPVSCFNIKFSKSLRHSAALHAPYLGGTCPPIYVSGFCASGFSIDGRGIGSTCVAEKYSCCCWRVISRMPRTIASSNEARICSCRVLQVSLISMFS